MLCPLANILWYFSSWPHSLAFRLACRDIANAQQKYLLRLLRCNAQTDFGRRYGFNSIRSAAEYQARVPLSTYEDYQEAIQQIGQGQPHILTHKPVLLLEPTSGSTAATKYIPYTAKLKTEFQRAIAPWVVDLFSYNPGLLLGQAYWSVTPITRRNERTSGGGIPIGFEEDSEYLGGWQRHLIQAVLAAPPPMRLIEDMEAFRYTTLLFLLRSRSLTFISVWNPTFLILLMERLTDWQSQLTADIANGVISPPAPLAPELQQQLTALIQPDRRRAREIQAIFQTQNDPAAIHAQLWPRLQIISCWTEAQAALHTPDLARLFPQARLQGKGLIATEGFVSLPLVKHKGAALAIRSHFFEFIPISNPHLQGDCKVTPLDTASTTFQPTRDATLQSFFPHPPFLAHELQPGGQYTVVITTGGGLYRYQLHDIVEVVGHLGKCPLIRFVGKEDYLSDWFGEKLNERHVRQVLDELFTRYSIRPAFAMLACDKQEKITNPTGSCSKQSQRVSDLSSLDSSGFAYTLFIEVKTVSDEKLNQLGSEIEAALRENYHYHYCRDLGQLEAIRVFRIDDGALKTYLSTCQAQGQRAGDIKPVALHRAGGWSQLFHGRIV